MLAQASAIGHEAVTRQQEEIVEKKRYWFPVRPARNGWGWGLPSVWQGWVAILIFLALLVGGSITLLRFGQLAVIANGFVSGGFLLAILFWKGEPQSIRDNSSP